MAHAGQPLTEQRVRLRRGAASRPALRARPPSDRAPRAPQSGAPGFSALRPQAPGQTPPQAPSPWNGCSVAVPLTRRGDLRDREPRLFTLSACVPGGPCMRGGGVAMRKEAWFGVGFRGTA